MSPVVRLPVLASRGRATLDRGCEDAVGGAVLFGHAAGSDRVGRTGPDETNADGFQCVLDSGVAGRAVGAVVRGDVNGVRSRGACNVEDEIDRVAVHDDSDA